MAFPVLAAFAGAQLAVTAGKAVFGKKNRIRDRASGQRETLLNDLFRRMNSQGGAVTDTPLFRSGQAQLQGNVEQQTTIDEARLAQLGASGSELEIAQTAGRNRALVAGTQGLTANAARFQQAGQNATIQQILATLGQKTQGGLAVAGLKTQREGQIGQSLGQALQAAVLADFQSKQGDA